MNPSEQSNDEMLSQHEEAVARKVPANERNRHGGLLFNSNNNRGNTTVEECDTDTDQQQNNFLNRLHQKTQTGVAGSN
jgi:hypothetical protein